MICPMKPCICSTVQSQSAKIWRKLSQADHYNTSYDEDTITQSFCLKMTTKHPDRNKIQVLSNKREQDTGADLIWVFYNPDEARSFYVAIQAKRLYPSGKYEAFKEAQAKKMMKFASKKVLPLYLLYNGSRARVEYPRVASDVLYCCWFPFCCFCQQCWPRNLGLLCTHASNLSEMKNKSLLLSSIIQKCRPFWTLFCGCDYSWRGSELPDDESFLLSIYKRISLLQSQENTGITGEPESISSDQLPGLPSWLEKWHTGESFDKNAFFEDFYANGRKSDSKEEEPRSPAPLLLATKVPRYWREFGE